MFDHAPDLARHPAFLLAGMALLAVALFAGLSVLVPHAAAFAVAVPLAVIASVVAAVELGGARQPDPPRGGRPHHR